MDTDNDDTAEVLKLMRAAIQKSRGYASYWEWAIDKRQAELHAASVLGKYLDSMEHLHDYKLTAVDHDPPDVLLTSAGLRYGIEVTEIVDEGAVKRAVRNAT